MKRQENIRLMTHLGLGLFFLLVSLSCNDTSDKSLITESEEDNTENPASNESPLFENSIASTEIDFIKSTDPDAFLSLEYIGQADKEMPDKRSDNLFDTNTYIFRANFTNNKVVEIWAHSSFGNEDTAKGYAEKLTSRLGKLPVYMRNTLGHVVIHKGNEGAFAEGEGGFFVLYSENMDTRISNNDLEETVFHESIHVAFDSLYAESEAWQEAQTKDGAFITDYAKSRPTKEDLAESAIFAYTMITHPGRLSTETEKWVETNIPNRLAFLKSILK